MPAGTVEDQQGVGFGSDPGADFAEMFAHSFGIGRGHDDGCANATGGADRAIDINGIVPVIPHHRRPGTDRRPDIGVGAFLAHAGFILKPYLDRLTRRRGAAKQSVLHQADEVF